MDHAETATAMMVEIPAIRMIDWGVLPPIFLLRGGHCPTSVFMALSQPWHCAPANVILARKSPRSSNPNNTK